MSVIEQVISHFKTIVGQKREKKIVKVTPLMIQRYALAIGDHNPLYHDRQYAQKNGFEDIIAPYNMLPSIVDWSIGAKEEDMHKDGTPMSGGILPLDIEGIKVMGGGEKMEFFSPLIAGTEVIFTSEIINTYVKEGREGKIAFLVEKNTFKDQRGKVFCTTERTILAR